MSSQAPNPRQFRRTLFTLGLWTSVVVRADAPLPAGLTFIPGPVNGAIVERGGRALVIYGDPESRGLTADGVLLAHARRDVVWAARDLVGQGARLIAPAGEAGWLTEPQRFWDGWRDRRFHDYAQQTSRIPGTPLPVSRTVGEGDVVRWENLDFRVLGTPGYTRGAVSYLVEIDGRKIAFTGDLIRDDGKLQDLFSLQDAIPEAGIGGYHGWAGRLGALMVSLDRIAAEQPDLLIPLRGPVIDDPEEAIRRLGDRIRAVYANYLSIDALRWYFKDEHIRTKARRVLGPDARIDWMPMAETLPLPPEILAIANARLLLAQDGSGFLIDCGSTGIIDALRRLRAAGRLTSLEHVLVTHYHDDHTDALPALVAEFGARVHACGSLIDLIERPGDYRLPCLTRNPTPVTAPHQDGDSWRWKEFRLTLFDFPGQTLHHNALLVEQDHGWAALFAGDSFTPSGIDDYCLQNRNILRAGHGYLACLDRLEQLPPGCLLLNQHVEPAFRFSPDQILRMRRTLEERILLLRELLPFDDPNFGLDDTWAAFHPYWIAPPTGEPVRLTLRLTNHSPRPQTFRIAFHAPPGFGLETTGILTVPPHTDGRLPLTVQIPDPPPAGRQIVTADIQWDGHRLRRWTEAVLDLQP